MLKVAVLVSGGGTNLQAILDAIDSGKITNTEIRVVISNNEGAYALERAKNYGTEGLLLSPKSFETREEFNQKLLEALKERQIDLVVLAGYLVVVPPCVIQEYENRIINIHPSLIPSFCGKGCYGLHVHEKALEQMNRMEEIFRTSAGRYGGDEPRVSGGNGHLRTFALVLPGEAIFRLGGGAHLRRIASDGAFARGALYV